MSKNYHVAILGHFNHDTALEKKILGVDKIDVIDDPEKSNKLGDYDGFLVWHFVPFTKEMIHKATKCKAICRTATGFDNIDIEEAGKKDIPVTTVPDYGTEEVADSAMCHILNLLRKNSEIAKTQEGKNPEQIIPTDFTTRFSMHRVSGKNLGIIGIGSIGTCVAQRAKAFGMNVMYYDPVIAPATDKALGIEKVEDLDDLLSRSDVITLHCPLNDKTEKIINKESISKMKQKAYLVNVARGELIDEDALMSALREKKLLGAALDVVANEPYDGRHADVPNLIITPHSAFCSNEAFQEMREKAAQELKRILDGEKPLFCVNQDQMKSKTGE